MVLGILFNAALGRTLGAGDFGLYFLLNSFSAFALILIDWGQQFFALRELAQKPERAGDILGTSIVLRTLGTVVGCLPMGLAAWALGYDRRTIWFSVAFLAINLPVFLSQGFGLVFRSSSQMGLDAIVLVVNRAAGLVLALAALALGLGLGGILVSQGLAGVVAALVAFRIYQRVFALPFRFSWQTAKELFVGGTVMLALFISVYAQSYIDAVILSKLVPRDAMGWYAAAKSIMGTLLAPALILGSAAFPRLSRAAGNHASFRSELATAQRPLVLLAGLAAVGTWLFADVAISVVYGQRHFGPAGIILRVFGVGLFLLFIDHLFSAVLVALGRSNGLAIAKVANVALCVVLELLLIPYFQRKYGNGGIGVTLAAAIGELVMFLSALWLIPRHLLGTSIFLDGVRAIGCAVLTGAIFSWLPPLVPWVAIPGCILTYAACAISCGLLRRDDWRVAQALFRREGLAADSVAVAAAGGSRLEP